MKYTVFYGSDIIHTSDTPEVMIIDPVISQEINKAASFTFSILPTHYLYDEIQSYSKNIIVKRDDEVIFFGVITSVTEDLYRNRSFECESALTFLNNSVHRLRVMEDVTALQFIQFMLVVHNLQIASDTEYSQEILVGNVYDPDEQTVSCIINYEGTLKCINDYLIGQIGGYIVERYDTGRVYLDYYAENYSDFREPNQPVQVGLNVIDMQIEELSETIATRVMPLGAVLTDQEENGIEKRVDITSVNGNVPYVTTTNENALLKYGYVVKTIVYDDVTKPETLLKYGRWWLQKQSYGRKAITVQALDLSITDSDLDSFKLLDRAQFKSKIHGIDERMTVTKRIFNLSNPQNDNATLGVVDAASISAQITEISGRAGASNPIKSATVTGTTSAGGALRLSLNKDIKVLSAFVTSETAFVCVPFKYSGYTYVKIMENSANPAYVPNTEVSVQYYYMEV